MLDGMQQLPSSPQVKCFRDNEPCPSERSISFEGIGLFNRNVYKMHSRLDRPRIYIDRETVSAFSNWPAARVPRGPLLSKDSPLSAATYPRAAHRRRVPRCAAADKLC